MKKFLLVLVVFFVCAMQMDAQMLYRRSKYGLDFDIAPKAGIGNAFFYNDNVHYDPDVNRDFLAPVYNYGGRFGISYLASQPKHVIFNVYGEFLFNNYQHKYTVKDYFQNEGNYIKSLKYRSQDIAVMFRLIGFVGPERMSPRYFEIGAKFSTLKDVNESDDRLHMFNYYDPEYDFSDKYNIKYTSIVAGIGIHGLFYNVGIRGTYSLGSLMKEGENVVTDGIYDDPSLNIDYTNLYTDPANTHLFTVELVLEINLYFFEVGTASCGKFALTPFPLFLNTQYVW